MRATSVERAQGTTSKLTCPDTVRELRTKCKLFQFESPYEEYHIDTTDLTPKETALMMRAQIEKCLSRGTAN